MPQPEARWPHCARLLNGLQRELTREAQQQEEEEYLMLSEYLEHA